MAKAPATNGDGNGSGGGGGTEIGNELSGVPLEYLIGAPLAAAIKAQKQLGHEMINFINMLAYGKEGATGNAGNKTVMTLPLELERPVTEADGSISTHKVTVAPPVLGLVPIPSLLIESVDINFTMEINSVTGSKENLDTETNVNAKAEANGLFYSGSLEVSGKVATQRENTRSTDKSAKYDITVHASQQPPTEGMARLMDLLASAVEPISTTRT
ncbi:MULTISPECIES: DUF2589 domain-containing protein [Roseobacteraceae]|uniref:DUF2589 domain-containing protein n=1 Tax=Roseobacteraceae TaxID=2854170 RepID=UPI0040597921